MVTVSSDRFSPLLGANQLDRIEVTVKKDCSTIYTNTMQLVDKESAPCKWRMHFNSLQVDPAICIGPDQVCEDVQYRYLIGLYIRVNGVNYNLVPVQIDLGVPGAGITITDLIEQFLDSYGAPDAEVTVTHTPTGTGDYTLRIDIEGLPYFINPVQAVMLNNDVCYVVNPFLCRVEEQNNTCIAWTGTIPDQTNDHDLELIYLEDMAGTQISINQDIQSVLADPTYANQILESQGFDIRLQANGNELTATGSDVPVRFMITPRNPSAFELPYLVDTTCTEYEQELIECDYQVAIPKTLTHIIAASDPTITQGEIADVADEQDDDYYYIRRPGQFWVLAQGSAPDAVYKVGYCYNLLNTQAGYDPTNVIINNNGLIFTDNIFKGDGVYSIAVKLVEPNGNFELLKKCILVDDTLKCLTASAILRQPNTRIASLYRALQLATECGDCECERACQIIAALRAQLKKVLGSESEQLYSPCK